jgi:hypothetical protein
VIEGEGLGGFARRHPINVMRAQRFLASRLNFSPQFSYGFSLELAKLGASEQG